MIVSPSSIVLDNVQTPLKISGDKKARYSDMLAAVIGSVPARGVTVLEMRDRLALLEQFDHAGTSICVSPSQVPLLKSSLANHRWPMMHDSLLDLADAVEAL